MHKFEVPYNQKPDWFEVAEQYKHCFKNVR